MTLSIGQAYQFCQRCGTRREGELDENPAHCGNCGYVQHFNPVAAVALVIRDGNGRVLLIRRRRDPGAGKLGLPGGFIDVGETAEEAAARELREELGVAASDLRFLMTYPNKYVYQGVALAVIDLFFTAVVDGKEDFRLAADEVAEASFLPIDKSVLEQMAFESNRQALLRVRDT